MPEKNARPVRETLEKKAIFWHVEESTVRKDEVSPGFTPGLSFF